MDANFVQTFCTLRCVCNVWKYVSMYFWKILRILFWILAGNMLLILTHSVINGLFMKEWCIIRQGVEELRQRKRHTWSHLLSKLLLRAGEWKHLGAEYNAESQCILEVARKFKVMVAIKKILKTKYWIKAVSTKNYLKKNL